MRKVQGGRMDFHHHQPVVEGGNPFDPKEHY
jgi:hypothetical protein